MQDVTCCRHVSVFKFARSDVLWHSSHAAVTGLSSLMCTVSRVKAALHTGLLATSRCTSPARSVGVLRLEPLCHCSFSIGMRHLHTVSILTAVSKDLRCGRNTVSAIYSSCVGVCVAFAIVLDFVCVFIGLKWDCCRRSLRPLGCMLHVACLLQTLLSFHRMHVAC